ncbi:ABC transporter permease [Caulobacter sp. KR2-114]|uniref:ABC transporter permease n=1 Tax=Caulobacter sp. KR2-114 TaxID=3400912 RepID=UPI003C009B36
MFELLRPYIAVLAGRFQLTLQYRAAALAGFATQCWFGVIRILVFAAFYAGGAGKAPMSLGDAITYTWLGQAFLAFLPWYADPEVAGMVRSGAVAYERLRSVDTYSFWYARALAWSAAKVLPRAALMVGFASVLLPLAGLGKWSLPPPTTWQAATLFAVSAIGMMLLSAAFTVLLNVVMAATMTDRGANTLAAPLANLFTGMVIPLAFFPDAVRPWLRAQPFAGLVDIPFSIYFGGLSGAPALQAIALQFVWVAVLVGFGRWWLGRVMTRLQIQGG